MSAIKVGVQRALHFQPLSLCKMYGFELLVASLCQDWHWLMCEMRLFQCSVVECHGICGVDALLW